MIKGKNIFIQLMLLVLILTLSLSTTLSVSASASVKVKWDKLKTDSSLSVEETWSIDVSDSIKGNKVVAVLVEKSKGTYIPATIDIKDNIISIDLLDKQYDYGKSYNVKIFLSNGTRLSKKITPTAITEIHVDDFERYGMGKIYKVYAKPDKGFNYPYYMYIPDKIKENESPRLLVEPNNTGSTTDNLMVHEGNVLRMISESETWLIAKDLNVPSLMPVFPRPETDYVYTHQLTRDAMLVKGKDYDRLDLQLTAIIKDAREVLKDEFDVGVPKKVFMIGGSASAKFTQRYILMHPDMVKAIAVTAIAGTTTLPFSKYKNTTLRYPVGISDLNKITGIKFNEKEYKKIAQYLYMGENDTNDETEWDDCMDRKDANTIWKLLGRDQTTTRWKNTQKALKEMGFADKIQFHMYKNLGHETTQNTQDDVINFFKANNGDEFNRIKAYEYGR